MFKKVIFLLTAVAVLAGCSASKNMTANTPKEAVEQLHQEEGYAEVVKLYSTKEVDKDRVIGVYRGVLDDTEEIYIANITKDEKEVWEVTDAIGIGLPSAENVNESVKTSSFEAGFVKKNEAPNPNTKLIEVDEKKFKAWVKPL